MVGSALGGGLETGYLERWRMGPQVRGERSLEINFSLLLLIPCLSLYIISPFWDTKRIILFFLPALMWAGIYCPCFTQIRNLCSLVAEPRVGWLISLFGVVEPAAAQGLDGIRVKAQPVRLTSQQLVLMSTTLASLSCCLPTPDHLSFKLSPPYASASQGAVWQSWEDLRHLFESSEAISIVSFEL